MSLSNDIHIRILEQQDVNLTEKVIAGLDDEINDLLNKIRQCPSLAVAEKLLGELADIQSILALLLFKYDAPLSQKQKSLVRQYDRSDVPLVREIVFKSIKEGKFPEQWKIVP
jgi:hypothetical protein